MPAYVRESLTKNLKIRAFLLIRGQIPPPKKVTNHEAMDKRDRSTCAHKHIGRCFL